MGRWRRLPRSTCAVLLAAIVAAGCAEAASDGGAATTTAPASSAAVTTAAPTTADATTAPTTEASTAPAPTTAPPTTQLVLPVPAPPPDPNAPEPVIPVGAIAIPKIGVNMWIYEGISETVLDAGPGHWPGTAMPGGWGNVVVAGHRVSKHKVFRHLDQLVPGDEIIYDVAGRQSVYVVDRTEIVTPDAMWIVDQLPAKTTTLFACHPPGSTRERIVVFATLREP